MKGDFSHDRFDPRKRFTRVLKQQGRVDLDADWNEQAAIQRHLMRTLIVDLFGRAAGPRDNSGFGIIDWETLTPQEREALKTLGVQPEVGDFAFGKGRYYVEGVLIENDEPRSYRKQSDWLGERMTSGKTYLAYLDVWERHITYIEDDSIREVALGGPDTCTRVKTMWQVKVLEASSQPADTSALEARLAAAQQERAVVVTQIEKEKQRERPRPAVLARLEARLTEIDKQIEGLKEDIEAAQNRPPEVPSCAELLEPLRDVELVRMRARIAPGESAPDPCVLPPDSGYRGLENHLYRIEIHRASGNPDNVPATFKWSRENGSVVTRWLRNEGNVLRVASSLGFEAGQWVELTDDADELQGRPGMFRRLVAVDGDGLTVENPPAWSTTLRNPKVRRWDQSANDELTLDDGAIAIESEGKASVWIPIEDGIEVQFEAGVCRSHDYWLIPARVLTGTIEWPTGPGNQPRFRPPAGVRHWYAPLALVGATGNDPFVEIKEDCRCLVAPMACLDDD